MKTTILASFYLIGLCCWLSVCMSKHMTNTILTLYGNTLIIPQNKQIVLVGGCFDILHFGHIQFLKKAKETGDYLIIALEPDERIFQKNRNPIHTQEERAENLLALESVDSVIKLPLLHGFEEYNNLVQLLKPHIIAVTAGDPQLANKQKQAKSCGAECIIVTESIGHFSSSAIYKALI